MSEHQSYPGGSPDGPPRDPEAPDLPQVPPAAPPAEDAQQEPWERTDEHGEPIPDPGSRTEADDGT